MVDDSNENLGPKPNIEKKWVSNEDYCHLHVLMTRGGEREFKLTVEVASSLIEVFHRFVESGENKQGGTSAVIRAQKPSIATLGIDLRKVAMMWIDIAFELEK